MDNPGLLSQSEIDALLAAISSEGEVKETAPAPAPAETPAENIKRYDFRRPDRFSKEQMRALRMIHETWARRAAVSLSAYLRASVEVTLADIDQGMYTSFAQQLPDHGVYYIIGLTPLPGHFMLHMNVEMSMMVVDRLMGGPGNVLKTERRLTELETELLRGTTEKLLADLQEAWANVTVIRPHIDDISLNLLLVPISLPTDAIVWASFEVRAKGVASSMMLGMPYPVLKPVASQLSPYNWAASLEVTAGSEASRHRLDLEEQVARLKLPIAVQLGAADISVEELIGLRPGDVMPLDMSTDGLCPVLVNGHTKFLGRVGLRKRKVAVEVAEVVEDVAGANAPDHQPAEQEVK